MGIITSNTLPSGTSVRTAATGVVEGVRVANQLQAQSTPQQRGELDISAEAVNRLEQAEEANNQDTPTAADTRQSVTISSSVGRSNSINGLSRDEAVNLYRTIARFL